MSGCEACTSPILPSSNPSELRPSSGQHAPKRYRRKVLLNFATLERTIQIIHEKALGNWKFSVKVLSKRLWKLTIITKRLILIIIVRFVNVND